MVAQFTYASHHPVQRTKITSLNLREPVWTEAVNAGSTLTAKITVSDDPSRISRIKEGTAPDNAAIYVSPGQGRISWGGVVKKRVWNSDNNEYAITAVEWRSWLYQLILGPKPDLTGTNVYSWTATDQLEIARDIITYAIGDQEVDGIPPITMGTELSGILRNFVILGTSFGTVGGYLDQLSGQDSGFEWDLECQIGDDGLPELRFVTYFPERGGELTSLLFKQGSTILSVSELEESTESRATRVWAIGEGPNAESLPYAQDTDPDVETGFLLRTDKMTSYQGVYSRTTLASYARAERAFLGSDLNLITFTVLLSNPPYLDYQKGDRCRVIIRDRVTDIDVSGVRILERQISPDAGSGLARITVNLNDFVALEVDEDGAV